VRASGAFKRPFDRIRALEQRLDEGAGRLPRALRALLAARRAEAEKAGGRLEALSPLRVLARGYSVTLKDGRVVARASQVRRGDALRTILHEGEIASRAE